ncbi:hypothetical protein MBAV_003182 [Candidatus Magnetobacterium bavaricum]|uniref:Uncharacterized protein n=1 Tax=Candidatus Magnetobacterium bavaricum TaxID=29290 RepID=A0A0F3GRP4_9BACT|nr:hypothetical protein MBAV_003182 [Candidatus Magnetobacterium bavaricum]
MSFLYVDFTIAIIAPFQAYRGCRALNLTCHLLVNASKVKGIVAGLNKTHTIPLPCLPIRAITFDRKKKKVIVYLFYIAR